MSVYFIQAGRYIKIGYSTDPERRFRRLMAGNTRYSAPVDVPRDLASRRLLRVVEGEKWTERAIHQALSEFCAQTEWFVDEPEVRDFMANIVKQDDEDALYEPVKRPAGRYEQPIELPGTAEHVEHLLMLARRRRNRQAASA